MSDREAGLALRVLGYPPVRWAGEALRLPTQKSLAILCYVVVRSRPATRDELEELLWPPGAGANLRPELHRLRRLPGADVWLAVGDTVAVAAESDLEAFTRAVHEERFEAALALHAPSEELLRGLEPRGAPAFDDWLGLERQRVRSLYRDALHGLALAREREGGLAEAVALARSLIELDPFDESAYRIAMRSEYRRGHVQAALAHAEACRRALVSELGVEPSRETLELERAMQAGAALPDVRVARPSQRIPLVLLRPPTLVGREREWARLQVAWEAGQTINLSGPPGIGKTRLMMDFARWHGRSFVLEGRPGDRVVPYSSLARALRALLGDLPDLATAAPAWVLSELARILPDLVHEPLPAPTSDEEQARLFEAIVHLMGLLRRRVQAIVVDDLQYLDARSFEAGLAAQARLLTERADPGNARIMAAFRQGELPESFERGLALAVDAGLAVHVALEPLDESALGALLTSLELGHTARLAPSLLRITGGNPQFIVELLKGAHGVGGADDLLAGGREARETVRSIMQRRLEGLEPLAGRAARAIAVLDQPADADALALILDAGAIEVTEALAELEGAQVLRDGAFVHDLVRETVASLTPTTTRAWLHRRVAEVLERTAADPRRVIHHRREAEAVRAGPN